jgi:protein-S-isoprenylcysteine O-methyltransferase Ste14
MAWLFVANYKFWFVNPFSLNQIISWILLFYSLYLVFAGVFFLKTKGKADKSRDEKNLYGFEKTTQLVDTGIFKYIRHPLYAALIFLTWAIFLKNPTTVLFVIALASTIFLYFTSRLDEKECIHYFGEKYREYIKRTKMFIPLLF